MKADLEREKEALRQQFINWRQGHIDALIASSAADDATRMKGMAEVQRIFSGEGRPFLENAISRMVQLRTRIAQEDGIFASDALFTGNRLNAQDMQAGLDALPQQAPAVVNDYLHFKAAATHAAQLSYLERTKPLAEWPATISWEETQRLTAAAFAPAGLEDTAAHLLAHHTSAHKGNTINASMRDGDVIINMNPTESLLDPRITAHETGHGIHYTLAGTGNITPTVAEIMSLFSEALMTKQMLQQADPRQRAALLANQLDTDLQYLDYAGKFSFEQKAYEYAQANPNRSIPVMQLWREAMEPLNGDIVPATPENRAALDAQLMRWDHYMHQPGYGAAYLIGWAAAPQLVEQMEQDPQHFHQTLTDTLKRGDTINAKEFLAAFDIDMGNPSFWQTRLEHMQSDLEALKASHRAAALLQHGNRADRDPQRTQRQH